MAKDKRIIKTKAKIKSAFMRLTVENSADRLTVSELSESAEINRSTFYMHYADLTEVEKDIEADIADTVSECIQGFKISDIRESAYGLFTKLTTALDGKPLLRKYILYSNNGNKNADKLKQILSEKAFEKFKETFPYITKEGARIPLTFAAAGIVDCFFDWAHTKENAKPIEEIIGRVSKYTEYIIKDLTLI